ncbi:MULTISPECIES: PAS domain S-box protein [Nostoc]|uniref:histidine kinase n=1 Tax=Nostoc paludosum FACHB-159 TaxID=2692908 RepID=A0ABR8K358_9NOSO|nr:MULTISPECIES: PAS domain S-box protein [Nostoc]MBD2676184.1 PAS domain S-box protein [Nostoc sp. FACHB-857]MBD2732687.1 PAS domain S-box protein [Nostoc paludosum FACHB-159]
MVQPLTVLIIDDSPEDRQVYRRYLLQDQEHSYTILEAELGEEALALCQQLQPKGILLDFLLPDMDGLEFLAELQQQSKGTMPAVIMLTGYGNESIAVQAMKSGVQDYLIKGQTTAQRLRSTVYSAIKNTQLRQQLQCSEERFRTSVENMLDCFGIYSAIRNDTGEILDFCVDYVNAAACEFTQINKEEQLGKGLCDILPNFRASDLFDDCCQVVETGNPVTKESLIYTSNFDSNQLLTKTIDIRITKMGDGFVASWRDVTEKYQAQQRLRSSQQFIERIAETTPGILYVYDLVKQQSVYINTQVSQLLGYTPEQIQQMGTQFLPTLMHPEDLARFPSVFQELGSSEENNIVENEYRMRHANGEWRWFFSRDTIFTRNPDGSPHQIIGTSFDITERKQTEEQLRLSNERFQLAAAAVNCLIYDWDVENDKIERTEGLTKILGYSLKEIPTTHQWWKEQIHPEDRERLNAQFHSIISANQNHYSVEYRARHKDQKYRYVLDQGLITRDANGRVIRTVGSMTDISDAYRQATQRKRAEVALQESEAKFRRIVESNIVGIYFGDFSGGIYEANDAFLETFGYTREDLAAGIIHWDSMTPPEYQTLDQQKIQELEVSGVCTPFEKEYLHKNGTRIPVLLGIARIESTNNNGYSVCFVLDLTQRKRTEIALRQSEERYRYLSNAMPQLVWICNAQGECEYVNERWYEFTGQRAENAMGFGWTKVIHPEDIEAAMAGWTQALQTGELYQQEIRYQKRDGSSSWHLVRGVPIKNEQGSIIQWFGTSTDIDDRKHLEAERNQLLQLEQAARTQAEAANRTKDEFVAMVSHDLRSPLNAILGWVQLLRTRKFDAANLAKALETIERNARSQEKLLEDLLNMSRILQGKLQLEVSQVNLGVVVGAAIETAYPSANTKNIRLQSKIDRSISPISGDINRLLQVLGNLLANAIKFTPPGGQVEISLFRNGSHAQITVSDTGIGISPEFLPYVFERYHQGHSTHKQGGLGLGLAIARHLVELHGGSIQVASPGIGQGATFSIKLPL